MKLDIAFQPKQEELFGLLKARGKTAATWLGYGGSRGGGKSGAIRRCATALAFQEAGIVIWIFRRVFDDLKQDHIDQFWTDFPALQDFYKITDHEISLPNKSKIKFVYAETSDEVIRKFRGPEAKYIFVDQAEQLSEEELNRIHSANRLPGSKPGDCKTVLCFNPGGRGTEFLRRVFWLKQIKGQERAGDFSFIQAYGWDNYEWFSGLGVGVAEFYAMTSEERFQIFVSQTDYGRKLNSLPSAIRIGELLGSFEHFAGQYFAGVWDEEKCVLGSGTARAMLQPWWTCWESQDWGMAHHTCHLWWAAGKLGPGDSAKWLEITTEFPIDIVIVYREYVINETGELDVMAKVLEMTPPDEQPERFFLSPDAWAKKSSANTIAEQYKGMRVRHGAVEPEPADDDRIGGWRLLYNGFRQASSLRGSVVDAERARQGPLLFISGDCVEVISAIPLAVRDEGELEDVAKADTLWDDVCDSLRYGYKSMLTAKSKAPRAIRRQMAYDSVQDMTAKALAMRKFDQTERQKGMISRGQRWR